MIKFNKDVEIDFNFTKYEKNKLTFLLSIFHILIHTHTQFLLEYLMFALTVVT
jgi:hypothetical protein